VRRKCCVLCGKKVFPVKNGRAQKPLMNAYDNLEEFSDPPVA
jgi:hypothetical protein